MKTIEHDNLKCRCLTKEGSEKITYIISPIEIEDKWIKSASDKFSSSIVIIRGMDWDNDLTPWPAKGVPKGSDDFKGLAKPFLDTIHDNIIPSCEKALQTGSHIERNLVGISLSGLFALWQWAICDIFENVACISGSFWYKDFVEWFKDNMTHHKNGKAFFCLGELESKAKTPEFRNIGENTSVIVNFLKDKGIECKFESVRGNHYQFFDERLDKALQYICL